MLSFQMNTLYMRHIQKSSTVPISYQGSRILLLEQKIVYNGQSRQIYKICQIFQIHLIHMNKIEHLK